MKSVYSFGRKKGRINYRCMIGFKGNSGMRIRQNQQSGTVITACDISQKEPCFQNA